MTFLRPTPDQSWLVIELCLLTILTYKKTTYDLLGPTKDQSLTGLKEVLRRSSDDPTASVTDP